MRFLTLFWPFRLSRSRGKTEAAIEEAAEIATRAAGVPSFRRSLPDLARELARARRYGRPVSLVILSLSTDHWPEEPRRGNGNGNGNGDSASEFKLLTRTSQVATLVLGSVLKEALRESDTVTYLAAHNQYVILLTESTKGQVRKAIERLGGLYYQRTLDHLRAGIAEFPSDGLTLEDLVVSAHKAWQEHSVGRNSQEPGGRSNEHRVGLQEQATSADVE